jgi:hypothetical protein
METIVLPRVEENRNLTRVVAFISALPKQKAWRLRIDELKGDRTEHQNNALFGVAYPPLCAHLKCTDKELHQIMCEEFFGRKTILGKTFPVRTTTTDHDGNRDVINWEVFNDFYAKVQEMGAGCGVWVPDPDRNLRTR